MTPTDEAAQSATVTARAAASLCNPADMQRAMQQAQGEIAASAEAMRQMHDDAERLAYLDTFDYDSLPSIDTVFSNSTLMQRWPRSRKSCELRRQAIAKRDTDFSLCNDAALSAAADQYEDWLHWRWTCGIGGF